MTTNLQARTEKFFDFVGGNALLVGQMLKELFRKPLYFDLLAVQIENVGAKSLPLILIVAMSVGMVMALQFGIGLQKFGANLYIPKLVSLSIIRELGPIFASLMFAARVGAGMTSEIASMVVTQQVDAMRALGTSPIKKIVIPRVLACLICLPLLCVFANAIGIFGGLVVGTFDLHLAGSFYWQKVLSTVTLTDYLSGFLKTFFFALFVAIPACYYGLNVERGTRAVGLATTRAVVTSSILILVGDYFLTKVFWVIQTWR